MTVVVMRVHCIMFMLFRIMSKPTWICWFCKVCLTHFRLDKFVHAIYWRSPILILLMSGYAFLIFLKKMAELFANSVNPDQTPHSAASDLDLHCLLITLLGVSRLKVVNKTLPLCFELLTVKEVVLILFNLCITFTPLATRLVFFFCPLWCFVLDFVLPYLTPSPPPVYLQTYPRWFPCCSSSLFVRRRFHIWRLFCHCLFFIPPF